MKSHTQSKYKSLNDAEILTGAKRASRTEIGATLDVLEYLVEVDSRRLYANFEHCSSLFDYLTKELNYSHQTASERVNTVRLMRAVPEVKEHLETGKLTLTSAAQIQRSFNAEQRVHPKGKSVDLAKKAKMVDLCLGQTAKAVKETLFENQSEPARTLMNEKIKSVTPTRSEIKFSVDEETLFKLQQLKDLIGNPSLEKIFDQALDALLKVEQKKRGVISPQKVAKGNQAKKMPASVEKTNASTYSEANPVNHAIHDAKFNPELELKKTPPQTEAQLNSRFIPIDLKRFVFSRSQGQCEYLHPKTKQRCLSRYRLQIDHVVPIALNGKTEASNLRHLCFAHNQQMAWRHGLARPEGRSAVHRAAIHTQ